MGFTKSVGNMSVHQGLSDTPNVDDALSAEQLKETFDAPAETLQEDINNLINELEEGTGASNIGASSLFEGDVSEANVQAKLGKLQEEITTIDSAGHVTTDKIDDGAVTTNKIADNNITTSKIADSNITTDKINDGAVTGNKLDANAKKAENISATSMGASDTYQANVQAKLNGLQEQITEVSQGGVADNSVGTTKIIDSAITSDKINNGAVSTEKIADGNVTLSKLASTLALFLVPSGAIVMWSGTIANIPNGWYLCNGQNGTPDLRNRFIVGAGDTYNIGNTGGEESHTLNVAEIPSHGHIVNVATSENYISGGSNTPILYGSGTTNTSLVGGGQAHENRPPYYALAYIMKA